MNKYQSIRYIAKKILLFLGVIIIASLLEIFSCMMDVEVIRVNISKSEDRLIQQGDYYNLLDVSGVYTQIDNWTEGTFLDMLYSVDNEHPAISAFGNRCLNNGTGIDRIIEDIHGNATWNDKIFRPAYWLGYRVYALLLISFFSYDKALLINTIIKIIITLVIIILLYKKDWLMTSVMIVSLAASNMYVCYFKFTGGSECVLVTLGMILYIAYKREQQIDLFGVFMLGGMLTCFLDWLTNPLLSLCIPLIAYIYMTNRGTDKFYLKKAGASVCGWGIGYVGMMSARQLIAYLVLGNQAIQYFKERLADDAGLSKQQGFLETLNEIYKAIRTCFSLCNPFRYINVHFGSAAFNFTLLTFFLLWILILIYMRKNIRVILYGLVGAMPMMWLGILHDTYVNGAHIGYKILAATFAGFFFSLIEIRRKNK